MMNSYLFLALFAPVFADIPTHCLRGDIAGQWQMHMTAPVATGQETAEVPDFTRGGIAQNFCHSGHPNTNAQNLNLNLRDKLQDKIDKVMFVEMTEKVVVHPDYTAHMRAFHGDSPDAFAQSALLENADASESGLTSEMLASESSWTTTYDEGFELRMKENGAETRLFALSSYRCEASNPHCGKAGDNEGANGVAAGYQSECGKTLVGWFHSPEGMGCFYGQKHDPLEADKVHSYVVAEKQQTSFGSLAQVHTVYHESDFAFELPSFSEIMSLHDSGSVDMKAVQRAGSVKRTKASVGLMKVQDECASDDLAMADRISLIETEHPIFDWREKLSNKWNAPVSDQGACGSCYAVAMGYSLQSRNNIALLQELETRGVEEKHWPEATILSSHNALSCTYYNQGCQGGFPFLTAKHAMEFGVPEEYTQPYGTAGKGNVGSCDSSLFQDEEKLTFAKDYHYVSGFYGRCGQASMLENIQKHGPITVALEVPSADFHGKGIVGESFLQTQDRAAVNPSSHSRHRMDSAASFLEASWGVKADDTKCATAASVPLSTVHSAMSEWTNGGYEPQSNAQHFMIDTSKLARTTTHPYATAKSVLGSALQLDAATEDCLHLQMAPAGMNNWEFTNHAVVVVGWGQQEVASHPSFAEDAEDGNSNNGFVERNQQPHKYWIVRNSWGPNFADHGHILVARGVDLGGIEGQAVHVEADLSRGLMKAKLDAYSKPTQRRTALLDLDSRVTREYESVVDAASALVRRHLYNRTANWYAY